ncbi:unnamed protein product [Rotaria sp. Silwood1]|nr:unnamed protein product [Rotaria sp. Silwood1]
MTTAKSITTFEDLSSEVIIYILDFLSPADRYNAFFDCNSRLRSLVKRWTQYSRKGLEADILRFSTLHSWYKHLDFKNGGTLYFICPRKGQQLRYSFDPRVSDSVGLHWRFIYHEDVEIIADQRVRTIVARHPFRLNPFFYHGEHPQSSSTNKSSRPRAFYGGHIIFSRYGDSLRLWLQMNYPDYVETLLNRKSSERIYGSDYDEDAVPIFDGEWLKAMTAIREAADRVWNELKDLDDINPLNT